MRRLTAAALAVGLAVTAVACGGGKKAATKATSSSAPTGSSAPSTIAAPPAGVAPLTGLPGDPAKLGRPALLVKIDNAPKARPQAGLNQADIVVEEGVEGGITRFATIFHSGDADPVGPVRSARTSDIAIAAALNRPLFAYSGTNADFEKLLDAAPIVNVGPGKFPGGYHRVSGRPAPYNYFSSTAVLFGRAAAGQAAPLAQFVYRPAGQAPAGGSANAGVHIEFRGRVLTAVDWGWDAAAGAGAGAWKRTTNGTTHVDAAGQQVTAANVVIEFVNYKDTGYTDQSGAPVPEAQLIGEGEAWILTGGQVVKGRWQKASTEAVTKLVAADGTAIALTPGRSWVELPAPGLATLRP
jgi:hypothetical protein